MKELLFSAQGRLNRAAFWKGVLIIWGVSLAISLVLFVLAQVLPGETTSDGSFSVSGPAAIPYLILTFGNLIFSLWAGVCLGIKRYHDRNKSGAWLFIVLIPFIGSVWYLIETGCLTGTQGDNRYGPDPLLALPAVPKLATI